MGIATNSSGFSYVFCHVLSIFQPAPRVTREGTLWDTEGSFQWLRARPALWGILRDPAEWL